jgi:hypothetical protein
VPELEQLMSAESLARLAAALGELAPEDPPNDDELAERDSQQRP